MPEVSVVIPVYNSEKYIEDCIKSLLSQSFQDAEFIFVDDGSSDASYDICRKYEESCNRVRVLRQKNLGPSAARNAGLRAAGGRYLCFADSDDMLSGDYLELLISRQRAEESYMPVAGLLRFKNTEEIGQEGCRNGDKGKRFIAAADFPLLAERGLFNCIYNKVYDLSLIREKGILFDESRNLGEDILFNIAYLKSGAIRGFYLIPEAVYYYRIADSSITGKFRADFYENTKFLYDRLFELARSLGSDEAALQNLELCYVRDLQAVLKHNCRSDSHRSRRETIELGKRIIKNENFTGRLRECIKKGQLRGPKYMLYAWGNYSLIYFVEKLWLRRIGR